MGQHDISNNALSGGALEQQSSGGYEALAQPTLDGLNELSILVSGVHCAGCIQKIESRLTKEQDIENVRLNFSTRRLSIVWKGAKTRANDYVALVEKLGYGVKPYDQKTERKEAAEYDRFLLLCLGVSGFATGNIMLLSIGLWSTTTETMGISTRELLHWISALIAIPAVMYSGRPFFRSAAKVLRNGHTNMDVPISIAVILSTAVSVWETIRHGEHVYFDAAVMLIFFLLIGRYLDFRARSNARSTASDLLSTLNGFASVVLDDRSLQRLPIRDLREGMMVQVASGEKFPVDGVILSGQSEVDTSLVTGETMPRPVQAGSDVYAGTLNMSAPLTMQVAKAAEDSLLADVVRLMEKAGQSQAAYVRIADRAARLYTPIVHTLALGSFLGWIILGGMDWQDALMIAVAVLIITCPCALALAVPVTQVLATGRLMRSGILVKSGDALERLARIRTIFFDKTGTLTHGKPALSGEYDPAHLRLAASLAAQSAHPLSRALAGAYNGSLDQVEGLQELPGQGLEGVIGGRVIKLGNRAWCGDVDAPASEQSEIWLNVDGKVLCVFKMEDVLRPDTEQTLKTLRGDGLQTVLLSGDRKSVVERTAQECGFDEYYAEQTPPQKYEILSAAKGGNYGPVMMVGDGLNDAPVLAAADIAMAPGTAIDMAQNAADIVFMGENLDPVREAYEVAKRSQILVKQNFVLTIIYNVLVIPMAIAGMVTPMIAAIAMSGSSLVVIANSYRIKIGEKKRA